MKEIFIEATDINESLEYLPFSLAESTKQEIERMKGKYKSEESTGHAKIECSPRDTNAECKVIQDQLWPRSLTLAHLEKMLISRPELFTNPDSKDK